jgi:hypothetical protein
MLHPSCSCLLTLVQILQGHSLNSNGGLEATRLYWKEYPFSTISRFSKESMCMSLTAGHRSIGLAQSKQVRRNRVADERSHASCHTASQSESRLQPQITLLKWYIFRSFLPLTMGISIRTRLAPSPTLNSLVLQTTSFFKQPHSSSNLILQATSFFKQPHSSNKLFLRIN